MDHSSVSSLDTYVSVDGKATTTNGQNIFRIKTDMHVCVNVSMNYALTYSLCVYVYLCKWPINSISFSVVFVIIEAICLLKTLNSDECNLLF